MMKHGKPGLAILIAEKAGKGKGGDSDADEGKLEAMKGFLAAVKEDDEEAALEEFENLCALCCEGGEEE